MFISFFPFYLDRLNGSLFMNTTSKRGGLFVCSVLYFNIDTPVGRLFLHLDHSSERMFKMKSIPGWLKCYYDDSFLLIVYCRSSISICGSSSSSGGNDSSNLRSSYRDSIGVGVCMT